METPSFDAVPRLMLDIKATQDKILQILSKQSEPQPADERLFSQKAAKHLGIELPTLYGKVSHRTIPYHKPPGSKKLVFLKSELDEYLAQGRRKTVKELQEEM